MLLPCLQHMLLLLLLLHQPPLQRLTLTASTGNAPAAVSPLSMTQSVPSSTALATSVASARVGRGFLIMLSSICSKQGSSSSSSGTRGSTDE
jgi:hypothetical protein